MEQLDDLFGAFDGEGQEQEENNNKKDVSEEEEKPKSGEKNGAIQKVEKKKSIYNTIMTSSVVVASEEAEKKSNTNDADPDKAPAACAASDDSGPGPGSKDENRQIATGTSHDKSVRSYSAYPKDSLRKEERMDEDDDASKKEPAKTYPFPLDPFQSQAVSYIEKEESVLVAAHTSAGKTAVAEYAIAKSLKQNQRVIYTSPIKALSNQKFRDLQEEFSDVGLMTGDITINNTATCLVMTTEILRSMLYRGSELMREVAWVIYDEVHYMRDSERGVVWEESIILLPHVVKFVFLSATIPNAEQFADWIAEIHHQPCHVVYTNYRPVPLQHYIFPQGGEGLHLVVDERGKFREANFQRAMTTLQSSSLSAGAGAGGDAALSTADAASAGDTAAATGGGGRKRKRSSGGGNKFGGQFNDLHRIVKLVMERNLNPVIIFSFSKKDCEKYALALNKEDYTDDVEKDLISQVYMNAIDSLSEDDRKLPQVQALLPLLKRGIGIHHGGLLPILKEIVEILFSEGLIKSLFATETFAIGINMPAKTVVFTNTRKWDGKDFRWVTSGEYIQMSGRAGRRGKDDRGIVIQMLDEKMEPDVCKNILYGESDPLNSSYKISYNMLLNLMRVEDVDPEYLLRASFFQFQRERDAPALIEQANEYMQQAQKIFEPKGLSVEEETLVAEYYQMEQQLILTKQKINSIIRKPEYILRYLHTPGRVVAIEMNNESYGWGVLVSCKKNKKAAAAAREANSNNNKNNTNGQQQSLYTLDILLNCVDRHFDTTTDDDKVKEEDIQNSNIIWSGNFDSCRPVRNNGGNKANNGNEGNNDDEKIISMRVFTVGLEHIEKISAIRMYVPQDVTSVESRKQVRMSLKEVQKRSPNGIIPLLDPITDMNIQEAALKTLLKRAEALNERLSQHSLSSENINNKNKEDAENSTGDNNLISNHNISTEEQRIQLIKSYEKKVQLIQKAKVISEKAKACQTMSMKDDLKKMKRVLKKLGHVDANGVIQTKGRTACEINTANELIVVELIFTGVFNDLSVEQCVSVLSCMTFDERMKDMDDMTKGLNGFFLNPFHKLREVAKTVVQTQASCNIESVDEDEFVDQFNPGMMEAVFAWCKGAKFIEIQKLTGTFEGTTIRTLRRLEELIRQIASATKAIGNQELQVKFEKAGELIKRDIVFCSSLYL